MFETILDSFLLSQVFGLYLVITAIIMLSRVDFYRDLVKHLDLRNGTIIIGASFGMLLGLLLVDLHNVWIMKPRVVVTVICWLILIASVCWLSVPELMLAWMRKIYAGRGYYLLTLFIGGWGCVLLFRGMYLFVKHNWGL